MTDVKKQNMKTGLIYTGASILCLAFGLIYEAFGFGVTSPYMHFAFLLPLLLGAAPYLIAAITKKQLPFGEKGAMFWHLAIATLTVGSFFRGALDIYGTSSELTIVYLIAGGILFLLVPAFSRKQTETVADEENTSPA
ncbi:MAG: hypothetical protein IJR00_07345 [Lachnospiraceae bacterium]|nr:hypothetical protein [Lachnospiraceae bacterium]